jgi:hypothetical protein
LRNAWSSSVFSGNIATSTRPQGSGQLQSPAGATRAGNLVTTANGVESAEFILPAAAAALPAPGAEHRGKMMRIDGGAGEQDRLFICQKDAAGKYIWRQL